MILLYYQQAALVDYSPALFFLKCHYKHNHNNSSGYRRLFGIFDLGVSIVTQSKLLDSQIFWEQKIAWELY